MLDAASVHTKYEKFRFIEEMSGNIRGNYILVAEKCYEVLVRNISDVAI